MNLNQQMEIPKWNTPLIGCTAQAYKNSSKKTAHKDFNQYKYSLISLNIQ